MDSRARSIQACTSGLGTPPGAADEDGCPATGVAPGGGNGVLDKERRMGSIMNASNSRYGPISTTITNHAAYARGDAPEAASQAFLSAGIAPVFGSIDVRVFCTMISNR